MPAYVVLTPEQLRLEQEANELLSLIPQDPDAPVYTEQELARKGRRMRVPTDRLAAFWTVRGQSLRDELRFLASVSNLTPLQRSCVYRWADGWSQTEIARRLRTPQQSVAVILRRALSSCYDATPLSFEAFSRRTIYRPPSHGEPDRRTRTCRICGQEFIAFTRYTVHCLAEPRKRASKREKMSTTVKIGG